MECKVKTHYIIGDSPVRAFAYNKYFLPIMISAGAFNAHLTEEVSRGVVERYRAFFEEYNLSDESVYFFTNADTFHHMRNTFNTLDGGNEVLRSAAFRYVEMVLKLRNDFSVEPTIISTIPINDENGMRIASAYNSFLKASALDLGIEYVDIWSHVTECVEGKISLLDDYKADDVGHLNHRFISELLKSMGFVDLNANYWDIEYERYYSYDLPIKKISGQPAKVWGDCQKENLIIESGMVYQFGLFHHRTLEHARLIQSLYGLLKNLLICRTITVDGCKEGYVAFELEKKGLFEKIEAYDASNNCISQANSLKKLFNSRVVRFSKELPETKKFFNEAVFNLTNNLLSKKNKVKYFKKIVKSESKMFIFYTSDALVDKSLLRKSGFSKIFRLNVYASDASSPSSGGCYLLSVNGEINFFVNIRLILFLFDYRIKIIFHSFKYHLKNLYKKIFLS